MTQEPTMTGDDVASKVAEAYANKILKPYKSARKFAFVDGEAPLYEWANGKQLFNAVKTSELIDAHGGITTELFERLNLGLVKAGPAGLVVALVLEAGGEDAHWVLDLHHRG